MENKENTKKMSVRDQVIDWCVAHPDFDVKGSQARCAADIGRAGSAVYRWWPGQSPKDGSIVNPSVRAEVEARLAAHTGELTGDTVATETDEQLPQTTTDTKNTADVRPTAKSPASEESQGQRKRGRPATGRTERMTLMMKPEIAQRLQLMSIVRRKSVAEIIEDLVMEASAQDGQAVADLAASILNNQ